jgi:hypothetical protein
MLNVNDIYNEVRYLIRKDKGGYITNAEFNAISRLSETMLWNFWANQFDKTNQVPTAMRPFVIDADDDLYVGDEGQVMLPDDFGRILSVRYGVVRALPSGAISIDYYVSLPLQESEIATVQYSAVRGPSITKRRFFHYLSGDKLVTLPRQKGNVVDLRYVSIPEFAVRAVTTDSTNDQENYTSTGSTQYSWPDSERNNLIDLLLMHYGISIRDSEIGQWVITQRNLAANSAAQTL